MRVCAIIPVFNNRNTIADVVKRCRAVLEPDVLVVSDGSTDGSAASASDAGGRMILNTENQGKGAAVKRGLNEAKAMGYTHAIVLDADGQHLPEDIPRLLNAVWADPEALFVCVRDMPPSATPAKSRRGRSISNFWTSLNGWQRCRDAQSGFRCYPIAPTLDLACRENGFAFEMEVLVRASWAGMRIRHIDVNVLYPQNEPDRVSHFKPLQDNFRASWVSFKLFWGMIIRAPVIAYRRMKSPVPRALPEPKSFHR